jgi:hypothetical protein
MSYGAAKSSGSISESSGSSSDSFSSSGSSSGCSAPASISQQIREEFEGYVQADQIISLQNSGYDPLQHNIEVVLTSPIILDYGTIGGVSITGADQFEDTFTVGYSISTEDGLLLLTVIAEGYTESPALGVIQGLLTVNFSCK